MTKPTSRADLVKAVSEAKTIVDDALPRSPDVALADREDLTRLRVAAFGVILRELLDYEVE